MLDETRCVRFAPRVGWCWMEKTAKKQKNVGWCWMRFLCKSNMLDEILSMNMIRLYTFKQNNQKYTKYVHFSIEQNSVLK